ncbi:metalloregulator ArsR/SmtB family transcription factor, partial [Microbacteriaceae bacterium K1510]|nr:metalloregulator ArsR/SmtB family transcription factor [Microbacteriaceae bacterium K1510]
MTARSESPFGAIADPTRRAILDLLLNRGSLTAGDIAATFPEISRPAVSKHLRVLREAGMVKEQPKGRERYYRLDPEPFRQMYEEWLN